MKLQFIKHLFSAFLLLIVVISCKKEQNIPKPSNNDLVQYARVFNIENYTNFTLLTIKNPFQKTAKTYRYVLAKKEVQIPDSLNSYERVAIPIKRIIVTSTTHIPALELLNKEQTLVGFPSTNYISSPKTRALIDTRKIKELNTNQALNVERILLLHPDAVVAFGINGLSKPLQTVAKMKIPVIVNGDWMEETALGKAEWIKFFGALYDKQKEANKIFKTIETSYNNAKLLAEKESKQPIVFSGALQGDKWTLPGGKSWVAQFLKDANSQYLWKTNTSKGSVKISLESVLMKAKNADFWIAPGFYEHKEQLEKNKHYQEFKAYKTDQIYSFTNKKGKTGGLLYFELAPQRPDLVLKDLIHIFHPELLPNYQNTFFEKLN